MATRVGHHTEPGAVYIGRPRAGQAWRFGNPFVVGRDGGRGACIPKFERWLLEGDSQSCWEATEEKRKWILEHLADLQGQLLGCFCRRSHETSPACHGDVLARLADRAFEVVEVSQPLPQPILFWSKGDPEWQWLSNFYPCPIVDVQGRVHRSSEHLYFYALCSTPEGREAIWRAGTAAEAKRSSKLYPQKDWATNHQPFMLRVLRMKFTQHADLKEKLLATGDRELVHYAPWGDTYWGVGKDMRGQNVQGKLIMQVRDELKKGG